MSQTIEASSLDRLHKMAATLSESIDELKKDLKLVESEILKRYGGLFKKVLHERGQEFGEVTTEIEGLKLKYAVSKTVTWDSEKLKELAPTIPAEVREKLFNVKIQVPEKAWQTVAETSIGKSLLPARTVKYGEPKISFTS